ncbi:olfactory receptor 2J3-like [Phacochoerus africanus]|uniref:olfactory receptor 2J3-like n=1 Tax=Phacochoerus africanus TaxID=41426 RepID=UPI001FD8E836|nr:olfactory receptor 2J3-like [Phacochoerus africanus]
MVQCSVALAPGSTECVLLAAMAIDPYVAVCWPILYATIMHPKICHLLAPMSWFSWFTNSLLQSSLAIVLPSCGCCHVEHFLCEVLVIIKLSSVDTGQTELKMLIAHLIILAIPVCIILTSHVCIAMAVVRMHSVEGRQNAFGTCASHLMVVSLFDGTIMFVYLQPDSNYSQNQGKILALVYTIVALTEPTNLYSKEQRCKEGN